MAVEIDDAQYKQLTDAYALLTKLHGNKETKRDFEKLAKKANPSAVTTDDLAEPYLQPLKDEISELRAFRDDIRKQQADWQEQSSFDRLRSSGYTDTGIDEIKKLMADRKIQDPEVAAAYWDKTRPAEPVAPNGISPSMWNFENSLQDNEEDMQLLLKNDDAWLDRQAARIMQEKR
jgi:hypothetical protein